MELIDKQQGFDRNKFPELCEALAKGLATLREELVIGSYNWFSSEGIHSTRCVTNLEKGSIVDSVLQAYQLTWIMEFSFSYLRQEDCTSFEGMLTGHVSEGDAECLGRYRKRYLDCSGDIDLLSSRFSEDLYDLFERPTPHEPAVRFLSSNAVAFGIMSQAITAKLFGDVRTVRKLKSRLRTG